MGSKDWEAIGVGLWLGHVRHAALRSYALCGPPGGRGPYTASTYDGYATGFPLFVIQSSLRELIKVRGRAPWCGVGLPREGSEPLVRGRAPSCGVGTRVCPCRWDSNRRNSPFVSPRRRNGSKSTSRSARWDQGRSNALLRPAQAGLIMWAYLASLPYERSEELTIINLYLININIYSLIFISYAINVLKVLF